MSYRIPLFDLNVGPAEEEAVLAALRSRWISMGERVQEVERRCAERLGVRHAVALTNCTAALHLALRALDLGPGDEVVVPSLTFVATVNAVRYVGATPVFADIVGPDDLSLDPADVARRLTPRTRAILVMHYGGFAARMDGLLELAAQHGLRLVEDAAHAPAAAWRGRPLGTLGAAGCFSFYANKNVTCAEGGLLVTGDDGLARRARLMRSHGMTTLSFERARGHATRYDVVELGYNYRLDDVRAALLLAQLDRLDADVARRAVLRARYVAALEGTPGLRVPYRGHADPSSNYIFPVVLAGGGAERRDAVRRRLADAGVETSVHYPAAHRFAIYHDAAVALPQTEFVADHEITLPLYPRLAEEQVDEIAAALRGSLA